MKKALEELLNRPKDLLNYKFEAISKRENKIVK